MIPSVQLLGVDEVTQHHVRNALGILPLRGVQVEVLHSLNLFFVE